MGSALSIVYLVVEKVHDVSRQSSFFTRRGCTAVPSLRLGYLEIRRRRDLPLQ
jgi:hypothetical protein